MLVMVTHGGGLKLWNHICQLENCCSCHFDFGWLKVQEKTFPKHWFSFMFDATVSIFLALILGRALLFHFCMHEGRSQHSVADMRVHCSILVTQIPWKFCPDNANMQRPFVLQTYLFFAEGRPDGVRKYGKMRPKYGNIMKYPSVWIRPNQKDIFLKTHLFFHRPSVHQSKLCQQLAPQGQGQWMCSIPVCIFQKCRNVQMFAPQLVLYLDTNRGSKVVLPRSFSHTPGSEMMCEGAWSNIRQDKHKTFTWFGLVMLSIQPAHAWKTNMESSSAIWSGLLHIKVK